MRLKQLIEIKFCAIQRLFDISVLDNKDRSGPKIGTTPIRHFIVLPQLDIYFNSIAEFSIQLNKYVLF